MYSKGSIINNESIEQTLEAVVACLHEKLKLKKLWRGYEEILLLIHIFVGFIKM